MCGIAGFTGFVTSPQPSTILWQMADLLAHRGPDDEGILVHSGASARLSSRDEVVPCRAGLGHRRLSILDPSPAGSQPLVDETGRLWITYNGEVYNYLELRVELEGLGHSFRSTTDTEVVLAAYSRWGLDCLHRFNGMFAFAILDVESGRLFAARDRFGIKPFYYTDLAGSFAFASETRALAVVPGVDRTLSPEALDRYLSFLWIPDPDTPFTAIKKLPPGHFLVHQERTLLVRRWWNGPFARNGQGCSTPAVRQLREGLRHSVRLRMRSDVPVGCFLSGGIDASAILALMSEVTRPVRTWTVGFSPEDLVYELVGDDLVFSREVARRHATDHHEIILSPDVEELFATTVEAMDEPIADPAALSAWLICKAAAGGVKVLLSGMGADEYLGGYPRHRAMMLAGWLERLPSVATALLRVAGSLLPASGPGTLATLGRNLDKFLASCQLPARERYLGFSTYFDDDDKRRLCSGDFWPRAQTDTYRFHRRSWSRWKGASLFDRLVAVDLDLFLPCLNLAYLDRMSMAHGIEVRVPFLDHELVSNAVSWPVAAKLGPLRGKEILRRAARGLVPETILRRRKTGFGAPVRSWLLGRLGDLREDLIGETAVRKRGLFEPSVIRAIVRDFEAGRADNALKIWLLMVLEQWLRTFIDRGVPRPAIAA